MDHSSSEMVRVIPRSSLPTRSDPSSVESKVSFAKGDDKPKVPRAPGRSRNELFTVPLDIVAGYLSSPLRKHNLQSFAFTISVSGVDARRLSSCHLTSCHLTSCHLISCQLSRGHPGYRATVPVRESAASSPGVLVGPLGQRWGQIDIADPSSCVGLASGSHLSYQADEKLSG